MISSFADLKKNAEELNRKVSETLTNNYAEKKADDRFWYPSRGKDGNGTALIRFLPAAPGSDSPFVKVHSYSFKGPTGKWYIENSLATIGQPDPCAEENSRLWNTGLESDKAIVRDRKRRTDYYFNVYVIKDSVHPENEGTVRILKGGPMWYNFIKSQLIPEFEDQAPVPVFDLWKGANFRIRVKEEKKPINGKQVILPNYDASTWDSPAPLFDDDSKLEEIWNQEHSLAEFIAPDKFKSYEQLKARLMDVIGSTVSFGNQAPVVEEPEDTGVKMDSDDELPWKQDDDVSVSADDDFDMSKFMEVLKDDD